MKALRTYQRAVEDAKAALPNLKGLDGYAEVSLVTGLLEDLTETLPAIEKREKARRERIQWVYAGNHTYVSQVGRKTFRVVFGSGYGSLSAFDGLVFVHVGKTGTSTESASRKIRAWRKK